MVCFLFSSLISSGPGCVGSALSGHYSCRSWSCFPLLWPRDTLGDFFPLNYPWCSCCPSLYFGGPYNLPFLPKPQSDLSYPSPYRGPNLLPAWTLLRGAHALFLNVLSPWQWPIQQMHFCVCLAELPLPSWPSWNPLEWLLGGAQ